MTPDEVVAENLKLLQVEFLRAHLDGYRRADRLRAVTSPTSQPPTLLPDGRHYAVMWGVELEHGGMSNAMLHRSRSFVRDAGVPITIITYDHIDDYEPIRAGLRERGSLIDGMTLINMWEDLRGWDDAQLKRAQASFPPPDHDVFDPLQDRGKSSSRFLHTLDFDDGSPNRADYLRADGTLLVSHMRDAPGEYKTAVWLCDRSGAPLGYWRRVHDLYRFWLDTLPHDPISYMIVDSKTAANHFLEYRRDHAVTLYMVHGSHLAPSTGRPHGDLSAGRKFTFARLNDFDGVVFLTDQQRQDVSALLGDDDNRYVCPNGRTVQASRPDYRRPRHHGVMIAALVPGKQIDQAITAIDEARKLRSPATLTIFGKGKGQRKLEKLIGKLELDRHVRLGGYTTDPRGKFAKASYSLLTSNAEGLSLVLIESMAEGCIPIAYDIAYGPGEIITHGVNGFLVEPGDTDSLARTIAKVTKMSKRKLRPMREAAIERARDFDDAQIVEVWAEIMESARRRKLGS